MIWYIMGVWDDGRSLNCDLLSTHSSRESERERARESESGERVERDDRPKKVESQNVSVCFCTGCSLPYVGCLGTLLQMDGCSLLLLVVDGGEG